MVGADVGNQVIYSIPWTLTNRFPSHQLTAASKGSTIATQDLV